ncbi:hypothetical protein [Sulfurimonas sp. HSL-1716]|uniref:hypothetical protein n=1 Tax=Hydrocurvibacter sulfurireducens TaxID=3131937 RepID=UPI0031F73EE1
MSSSAIKRHNHRVLPCDKDRKIELINFLIEKNSDLDIAIIAKETIDDFKAVSSNERVKILDDSRLDSKYDLIINYDLPKDAQQYLNRISLAKTYAFILLDPEEQKLLYPIETLLGRSLVEEVIKKFETTQSQERKKAKAKKEKKAKRFEKERQKERDKEEKKAQSQLPPKRTVRKIVKKD